ncbi:MAG TPA: ribonuclease domain-containing protein [Mycobacteriales bacterium]|nr:ribonuclease domain-containing protein [Mycobacteriales bacterium]
MSAVLRPFRGIVLALALLAGALVGPSVVTPAAAPQASASVFSSCTISGCSAARTALTGWRQLGLPTARAWFAWPFGQYNFSGGQYKNLERELPANQTYAEYDVNPRPRGAARDAARIIVSRTTGSVWYTPNHYTDFYKIA